MRGGECPKSKKKPEEVNCLPTLSPSVGVRVNCGFESKFGKAELAVSLITLRHAHSEENIPLINLTHLTPVENGGRNA